MNIVLLFCVTFGVGPLLYRAGISRAEALRRARFVMLVPALLGLAGYAARVWAGASWGKDIWATLPGIALIWLGWIALLVYCTALVLPRLHNTLQRRVAQALGAIGTTLPWFGLASAQLATG